MRPPLIGLPCCTRVVGELSTHWVGDKYVRAVSDAADAVPLLLPALSGRIDAADVIAPLDGLLLTGSRSNVEPHHYAGTASVPGTLHDPERDALTLPLIRAAVGAGLPVLAICRGIQELNVALGGTLHQRVHELAGRLDHRAPEGDVARRYAHTAHTVALTPGGMLEQLAGTRELVVNSLHSQGIDRLALDAGDRGDRARRPGRGGAAHRRGVRRRRAVASRIPRHGESLFARAVRRLRRSVPRLGRAPPRRACRVTPLVAARDAVEQLDEPLLVVGREIARDMALVAAHQLFDAMQQPRALVAQAQRMRTAIARRHRAHDKRARFRADR